jgi:cytochrome c oxidase assembly protein subunit 11
MPLVGIVVGMVMLAYASVPLYQLFCQVTGFGGTTKRAEANFSGEVATQTLHVRFNADTDPALPWRFTPLENEVTVRIGENRLVAFKAKNISGSETRGTATYNVTPNLAGKYFNKIQCFCFEEQKLHPGEEVTMPVSFFIDPAILDDPALKGLTNITLSYTFFSYESANHTPK